MIKKDGSMEDGNRSNRRFQVMRDLIFRRIMPNAKIQSHGLFGAHQKGLIRVERLNRK